MFLERAAAVYPEHIAVVHGSQRFTYAEFYARARRLASALAAARHRPRRHRLGDARQHAADARGALRRADDRRGAAFASTRGSTRPIIAFQLDHADAKVVICDREFAPVMREALALAKVQAARHRLRRPGVPAGRASRCRRSTTRRSSPTAIPAFRWRMPADEWDAIALNYTSGTTGNPKGVVYHHRGAHLMCYANVLAAGMGKHPVYLWTLPMFHCNGWCFPWTLSAVAGTHVCLRWVRAEAMYDAIAEHKVTHLCGAPIVMSTLLNATPRGEARRCRTRSSSSPPPRRRPRPCSRRWREAGFNVTHVYGLTEVYGPAVVNEWHARVGRARPAPAGGARRRARACAIRRSRTSTVMDPETMTRVPADGETLGEVMFRGNIVMKGYLKNPQATEEAFAGGWFHSGDLGVLHPDGYIQLKDRSKDIIISGGENISSIEVEDVLYKHPAVAACAVVGKPDEKWGETPVRLHRAEARRDARRRRRSSPTAASDLAALQGARATSCSPRCPKTSTGKIQKFVLRETAKGV